MGHHFVLEDKVLWRFAALVRLEREDKDGRVKETSTRRRCHCVGGAIATHVAVGCECDHDVLPAPEDVEQLVCREVVDAGINEFCGAGLSSPFIEGF